MTDRPDRLVLVERERRRRQRERAKRGKGLWTNLRKILGLGGDVVVQGVRYRARARRNNARATVYDVVFPTGETVKIRPSAHRVYNDLAPCPRTRAISLVETLVRPGARVLVVGAGTGAVAETLGSLVGPSGGVIALERDPESVRFARRRYPRDNVGFELLDDKALRGELSGSFAAALLFAATPDEQAAIDSLFNDVSRVVLEDGWVFVGLGPAVAPDHHPTTPAASPRTTRSLGTTAEGWRTSLARRQDAQRGKGPRTR